MASSDLCWFVPLAQQCLLVCSRPKCPHPRTSPDSLTIFYLPSLRSALFFLLLLRADQQKMGERGSSAPPEPAKRALPFCHQPGAVPCGMPSRSHSAAVAESTNANNDRGVSHAGPRRPSFQLNLSSWRHPTAGRDICIPIAHEPLKKVK